MGRLTGMLQSDMPIDRDLCPHPPPVSVPQKGKSLPSQPDRLPIAFAHRLPFDLPAASGEVPVGLVPKGNVGLPRDRAWPFQLQLLLLQVQG